MRGIRHRRRHSHKLLAGAIAILTLAGFGGTAIGYISIKPKADQLQAELMSYLQAGQKELEAGRASLAEANSKHDATLVPQAITHFGAAKVQFVGASGVADHSNLLRYLESVPAVGNFAYSRHTAVDDIAAMGSALSDAGQDAAELYRHLIIPSAPQAGRTLLTVLDITKAGRGQLLADLRRAHQAASGVDVQVLPYGLQTTLLRARDTINAAISDLAELERLIPVLVEVFGGNGPRTYLVEQVNPAELRAGGGFIGTYSLLRADGGRLSLLTTGNAAELAEPRPLPGQQGFVPQPGPYRQVIPEVSWSFLDSNLFPDFPSNARAAEQWVQPRLRMAIDGVISMDYYTVARMLETTGPLTVPGYGTVTAGNFIPQIMPADIAGAPNRKSILSTIAGDIMERVTALPPDQWPALLGVLNDLAQSRHLQAYLNNSNAQLEMERVAWSGSVNPRQSLDYMLEIEDNYYGDKANYFLSRNYTLVLTRKGNKLRHNLTVDLVNDMPCGISERTSYRANLRLYVSGDAAVVTSNLKPATYANPAPPIGLKLLDGWVPDVNHYVGSFPEVSCGGGHGSAVLQFDTPWIDNSAGPHQIYWQKQPGTLADKVVVTLSNCTAPTCSAIGDLGQDRIILITPTSLSLVRGEPATGRLPSLSLG